jgi:hypothetical protein
MLYLLKGSRIQEYHQQNLRILGAAEGEVAEIVYNRRWVAPGLTLRRGDGAVLVFADSPYEHFVPVRYGVLEEVEADDDRVRVVVGLKTFVRAGGAELLTDAWRGFDRNDDDRPGRRFLLEAENPGLEAPASVDELDDAWRDCCGALGGNGYFARSTIARVRRVCDERGIELDHATTPAGATVSVEIETATPTADRDEVELVLGAEPDGSLAPVGSVTAPAAGVVTVELVPVVPGPVQVRFDLLPDPARSSRPVVSLAVTEPNRVSAPPSTPAPVTGDESLLLVPDEDLARLVVRLQREGEWSDQAWLDLFDGYFGAWGERSPRLVALHARAAYQAGDHRRAADLFGQLSRRSPEDDFTFVIASLRAGRPIDVAALLDRIDLNAEAQFEELLDALDGVERDWLARVVQELAHNVLGEDKLLRLLDRVMHRLNDLDVLCELAERAAYADPERGAGLLLRRWPEPVGMPQRPLDQLVDWEAQARSLGPYLEVAAERAASSADWLAVKSIADKARRLPIGADQGRVLVGVGDALLRSGDPSRAADGFAVLADVVADAAARGDLDVAVRYADALAGYAAVDGDESLRAAAKDLVDRVAAAMEESESLRDWRAKSLDHQSERVAKRLRGKVLHLVGGQAQAWGPSLQDRLGLAEVRWHETEKSQSAKQEWLSGLDPERDVVVVLWEFIGHDVTDLVKGKCRNLGVPRVEARTSEGEVIDQLDRSLV